MSLHRYAAVREGMAVSTSGFKTMFHIPAGTSTTPRIVVVRRIVISFDGTSAAATPIKVSLKYQNRDSPNAGTPAGSITPTALGRGLPAAVSTPVTYGPFTVEPTTATDPVDAFFLTPNGGFYDEPYALDCEIEIDGNTQARAALGILMSAGAAVNTTISAHFEE